MTIYEFYDQLNQAVREFCGINSGFHVLFEVPNRSYANVFRCSVSVRRIASQVSPTTTFVALEGDNVRSVNAYLPTDGQLNPSGVSHQLDEWAIVAWLALAVQSL